LNVNNIGGVGDKRKSRCRETKKDWVILMLIRLKLELPYGLKRRKESSLANHNSRLAIGRKREEF